MVQFRAGWAVAPTAHPAEALEDAARRAAQRLLPPESAYEVRGGALVDGGAAGPLYVVVVECVVDALPERGALERSFGLTAREAEVALLAGRRLAVREMAQALGVTTHTIRRHVERVLSKLQVARRQEVRQVLLSLAARERRAAAQVARLEEARRARRLQTAAA